MTQTTDQAPTASDQKYVFMIGAAKCGTTALADMLGQHPDINLSNPKEPDFFARKDYAASFGDYERCFDGSRPYKYRLDASVGYSAGWNGSSRTIAKRLAAFCPTARLIYVIRDPIERTRSAYWHAVRGGYEDLGFWEAIHQPEIDHITASQYSQRIDEYCEFFDPSQLLIVPMSDLRKDPDAVLKKIMRHLELPEVTGIALHQETNRTYQLSQFGRLVHRVFPKHRITSTVKLIKSSLPTKLVDMLYDLYAKPIPEMRQPEGDYLAEIFAPEVAEIERRYGINLKTSKWWAASSQ